MGRIVLTITTLLLLLGGIALGVFLVRQNQEVREKAQETTRSLNKKVLQVVYNPTFANGDTLHSYFGWQDPVANFTPVILDNISDSSGGYVNYEVVETVVRNEFPKKLDGFRYTEETYKACRSNTLNCHFPDDVDYNQMWTDLNLCQRVSSGEIDEIVVWGGGYLGFDEFAFKVPGDVMPYNNPIAYWLYDGRKKNIPDCNGKTVFVMGYIPEVGIPNSVHSYSHRIESALALTVGRGYWDGCYGKNGVPSDFDKFTCLEQDISPSTPVQVAGCGNTHSPPNGQAGYDYGNQRFVTDACESFKNYPYETPTTTFRNCSAFNCNDLQFYNWWFDHIPRSEGVTSNGNLKNWWKYIVDFDNAVTEAKQIPTSPPTPSPSPTPAGTFSATSATLNLNQATFNFNFSGPNQNFKVDLSTQADMSWDVYLDFATGPASPVVISNPTKWDKFACGTTLYWKVSTDNRSVTSGINSAVVCPPPPTPTSTPTNTPTVTPTNSPTPTVTGTPTPSLPGDINGNGRVDIFDYNTLISHFGDRMPAEGSPADLNGNGRVDIFDYNIIVSNFGRTS